MKICCIVETVYQLINAVNLLNFDKDFKNAEIDLFVRKDHYTNSTQHCEQLKKNDIFNEIQFYSLKDYSTSNTINHLRHIPELFISKYEIQKAVLSESYSFNPKKYDIVLTPNACQFYKLVMLCCKKAKIYCYEDGALSYGNSNWIESSFSEFSKKMIKILHKSKGMYPERVYLYNPDLFIKSWDTDVKMLPKLKEVMKNNSNFFYSIFGRPVCDYNENKLVFLSQPSPVPYDLTQAICNGIERDFICRYHPRNPENVIFSGIQDRGSSQWELICADSITDNHILVGACSSAQTSPKWLFNKEPYIIFIYPIYKDRLSNEFIDVSKSIVQKTKSIYRNPEKVMVVNSLDELNITIKDILN